MKVAADSAPAVREQFMRVALTMAERGMAAGGSIVGTFPSFGLSVVTATEGATSSSASGSATKAAPPWSWIFITATFWR